MDMFRILFGKDYEKKVVDSIIDKSVKSVSERLSKISITTDEAKKSTNEEAKINIEKEKLEIEKQKIINVEKINNYLSFKIQPTASSKVHELTTEETKIIFNHIIEEKKLIVARESSKMAARTTLKAAGIRGCFALFSTGMATAAAYYYFRPIQEESEKNKKELKDTSLLFISSSLDARYKGKIIEAAEEFVKKSKDKEAVKKYYDFKQLQENKRITESDQLTKEIAIRNASNNLKLN